MIRILKNMRREDVTLLLANMLTIIANVWLDLKIPDYMSTITSLVKSGNAEMSAIISAGGMMLLCALGSVVALVLTGYVSARFAASFSRTLRRRVFERVEAFSMEEIDRFSTASLITRSTNDVAQIQNFASRGIQQIISAPITAVIAVMKISGSHWQWTASTCIGIVIIVTTIVLVVSYAQPRFRKMQILTDGINRTMRDNMTGIRVVRAYNAEEYQEGKFEDVNYKHMRNNIETRFAMGAMHPVMQFVQNMLTVSIYCIGAYLIAATSGYDNQLVIFSEMVVFSTYASKLLFAFMSLNMIFMQLPRATVSADRLNAVLDTEPRIFDGTETEGIPGKEGEVEFRNVSFRYPDSEGDVLSNVSFTAKKGETVAFIGATGSGKSSLVNLVPRFFDVTEGQVLVSGRDVREYTQAALHNKLGIAPQRAILFTGTVASNVSYGDNGKEKSSDEDIKEAVRIAQAEDFVTKMDGSYDAIIARGGTNVSGGQRQRLSIARAINRKPEVYIFDDTFSALDYKTDRILRAELKKKTAGTTTLLVAQRIGTIRDADKIIVLDEGKVVGMGTHDELMKNCDVYQEIAYTQLSEEELR